MAYAAASDVGNLTRNLLGAASGYDTSTSPALAAVTAWLSSGCAIIESVIFERDYGAVPTTSVAYQLVAEANALYAAWFAERSRQNARTTADERTRADFFKKDFNEHLDLLKELDFSKLGMSQTAGTNPDIYAGGISISDKASVASDTDRPGTRFAKGMFRNNEVLLPVAAS